jgi:hypothetical protein
LLQGFHPLAHLAVVELHILLAGGASQKTAGALQRVDRSAMLSGTALNVFAMLSRYLH